MGIQVTNLAKIFDSNQGQVQALAEVSFAVTSQEFVSIVGPSGCGKSTLLRILAGLIEPSRGKFAIDVESGNHRPQNAMVFQGQGLFPWMNLLDNVGFGMKMRGARPAEIKSEVMGILSQFGLEKFHAHFPHELSGGMRQRAALARAFLADPDVLLMDEPFGALDAQSRLLLQQELLRIWQANRKTILFVTHDIEEAILLSDRIIIMSGRPGRIIEDINIPLKRPRNLVEPEEHELIGELKGKIWNMLESEVKSSMEESL
ncbi:MAG: ABC transporter ATP-binding protein [Anaerolineae bacterium]|nr:MAG: ABC transporter ATP-binding protein [Anaerolineae bacterium]